MSVTNSFRLISNKIPPSFLHHNGVPLFKTLVLSSPSTVFIPKRLFDFKSITVERIPTKSVSSVYASSSSSPSVSLQPIEELPPKLQEIVKLFQAVEQPKAKYEQLLFYGRKLVPLDAQFKTAENKVQGCVSQVWVRAYLDPGRNVVFEADSDSVLTKGLAALLVQGLSGRPVEEILRVSPDFVVLLGLQQSLTPSRNNGFLNMLKLMQKKALQLYVEAEKGSDGSSTAISNENPCQSSAFSSKMESVAEDSKVQGSFETSTYNSMLSSRPGDNGLGSRGKRIKEMLERELQPIDLEIEDISYQHAGHAGVRGSDGETHFNVKVVSKNFEGKSLVKRHRLIYDFLQDELQNGLHALSIVAKTPSEVDSR